MLGSIHITKREVFRVRKFFSRTALAIVFLAMIGMGTFAQNRTRLTIDCDTVGAQVLVNGRPMGVTRPQLVLQLPPGTYTLTVRHRDYPAFNTRVSLGAAPSVVQVRLAGGGGGGAIRPLPQQGPSIRPLPSSPQPAPTIAPLPATPPAPMPATPPVTAPAVAAPASSAGSVPVNFYWHAADTADVYINGVPIKQFQPDFKSRSDEAPKPAFSARGELSDGDIITVGTRRGGSYGFMMIAVDDSGTIRWKTDARSWFAYSVPSDGIPWYDGVRRLQGAKRPVEVNPSPWPPQVTLNGKFGNAAQSIYDSPGTPYCYLVSQVSLDSPSAAPSVPAFPAPAASVRIEGESYKSGSAHIQREGINPPEGGTSLAFIEHGAYAYYGKVDFGSGASKAKFRVASATSGGRIEIRLDAPNSAPAATIAVPGTGGWHSYVDVETAVSVSPGSHDLYLVFTGPSGYLFNINWFEFDSSSGVSAAVPSGNPAASAPVRSGPSGTAWTKLMTPQWPFTYLASFPDGSFALASEGSGDVHWSGGPMIVPVKRSPPDTSFKNAAGLFIGPDGSLTLALSGAGILRTADRGATWTAAAGQRNLSRTAMTKSGVLISGDNGQSTLRSADGGKTWKIVVMEGPKGRPAELSDGTLYQQIGSKLMRSADGGSTWREVSMPDMPYGADVLAYGDELIVYKNTPAEYYGSRSTYSISSGGRTKWESMPYFLNQLTVDRAGDIYAVRYAKVHDEYFPDALVRSRDGGRTYEPFTAGLPTPIGWVKLWPAADGGVYASSDGAGSQTLYKLSYDQSTAEAAAASATPSAAAPAAAQTSQSGPAGVVDIGKKYDGGKWWVVNPGNADRLTDTYQMAFLPDGKLHMIEEGYISPKPDGDWRWEGDVLLYKFSWNKDYQRLTMESPTSFKFLTQNAYSHLQYFKKGKTPRNSR